METYKKQVMNYLTKTAGHTFQFTSPSTNDKTYFKVFIDGEKVSYLFYNTHYKTYSKVSLDVDFYVKTYKGDAKCVISNVLFLNRISKAKSVKQNKYIKAEIAEILKNIK